MYTSSQTGLFNSQVTGLAPYNDMDHRQPVCIYRPPPGVDVDKQAARNQFAFPNPPNNKGAGCAAPNAQVSRQSAIKASVLTAQEAGKVVAEVAHLMGPVVPKHMSTDQLLAGVTAALTMNKEETVGKPG